MTIEELKAGIQDKDAAVRTQTWQDAAKLGAAGIAPLAEITESGELEVHRAAERGLWAIVRHAGRPGAGDDRKAVCEALTTLLKPERPETLRRQVAWMLSEIGDSDAVAALSVQLADPVLREDARMAIERIPGEASVAALKTALDTADDDFKPSLAQGLRARGVDVEGIPCEKLVPTRETEVEAR